MPAPGQLRSRSVLWAAATIGSIIAVYVAARLGEPDLAALLAFDASLCAVLFAFRAVEL